MKIFRYIVLLIIINIILSLNVNALDGYVNSSNGINFRDKPTTNSNVIFVLDDKMVFTVLDVNLEKGNGCTNNWYKINYNNTEGYICSDNVILNEEIKVEVPEDLTYNEILKNNGFTDPTYYPYLTYLHQLHPNWEFVAIDAKADFYEAVNAESACNINLIPATDPDHLKNVNCKNNYHDWVTASSGTIAYYMDPRNFLNETNIFMFESQYRNNDISNETYVNAVSEMFRGRFIYEKITDLPQFITNAGTSSDGSQVINPIAIASRIKQELGSAKLTSGKDRKSVV